MNTVEHCKALRDGVSDFLGKLCLIVHAQLQFGLLLTQASRRDAKYTFYATAALFCCLLPILAVKHNTALCMFCENTACSLTTSK